MSEKKKHSCWEKVSDVLENVFWWYAFVFVIFVIGLVMIAVIYLKYEIIRASLIIEYLLAFVLSMVLISEEISFLKFQDQNIGSFLFYCLILPITLGLIISTIGYTYKANLPENIKDYIKTILGIDKVVKTDIVELSYKIMLLMEGLFCSYWYGTKILSYDLISWVVKKFLRGGKVKSIVETIVSIANNKLTIAIVFFVLGLICKENPIIIMYLWIPILYIWIFGICLNHQQNMDVYSMDRLDFYSNVNTVLFGLLALMGFKKIEWSISILVLLYSAIQLLIKLRICYQE